MNSTNNKYYDKNEVCRSHSARNGKDVLPVNPPNLKRKDLEDAYYSLFENHQNLKHTVNCQNEKLKILSTKLLRLTASQRSNFSKANKCCVGNQSLLSEKDVLIKDLKNANHKLTEKIRQLNMKLCSIKQFLKKSSNKCAKCALHRKASTSFLLTKRSDTNLHTLAASTQCNSVDKLDSVRSVETNTEYSAQFESSSDHRCADNKCKTKLQDEQLKISQLQTEIHAKNNQYLNEIANFKEMIDKLQRDNITCRSEQKISDEKYNQGKIVVTEIKEKLLKIEADYYAIKMQLSIEQKKVTELETQVRTSHVSNDIVNVIDQYLCSQPKKVDPKISNIVCSNCHKDITLIGENNEDIILNKHKLNDSTFSDGIHNKCTSTPSKDDSGYIEGYRMMEESLKSVFNMNQELKQRVLILEQQLDLHKATTADQANKVLKQITEDLLFKEKNENLNDAGKITNFTSNEEQSDSNKVSSEIVSKVNNNSNFKENNINNTSVDIESPHEAKDQENGYKNEEIGTIDKINVSMNENGRNASYTVEKDHKNTNIVNPHQSPYKEVEKPSPKKYGEERNVQKHNENKLISKYITKNTSPVRTTNNKGIDKTKQKETVNRRLAKHSLQKTYSIEKKDGVTSPDNTENDVSSITNESTDRNDVRSPSEPLSLGEDRRTSSETTTSTGEVSSSELGYLSEGEIAVNKGPAVSVGEKYIKTRRMHHQHNIDNARNRKEMAGDTLEAIRAEIIRCRKLMLLKPKLKPV